MPTSAGKWTKQKSDTVLPLRSGTTAWQLSQAARGSTAHGVRYYRGGADVKNYIRPYYRDEAALGLGATVLRLRRSGTTVGPHGTTALDERYYHGGRGRKKLHPPLLPHWSGTRPRYRGTTAPEGRYYRDLSRYYRVYLRYYRKYSSSRQFFAQQ